MATTVEMEQSSNIWGGAEKPFGAKYGKMMMWFFLVSDALSFSGFLVAYGFMRYAFQTTWPVAEDVFTHFPYLDGNHPLIYVALMTFILIMSSVTMVLAVQEGKNDNKNKVIKWMLLTIVGGGIFLGSQAWEWFHFIQGDKGGIELNSPGITSLTYEEEGKTLHYFMDNSTVMHVINKEDERVSFSQMIHGMEHGHASNHADVFTTEEVLKAFKADAGYKLITPGKTKLILDHREAVSFLKGAVAVQGANMTHNEYGKKQFANFFFFITGFHGFHVFSGVLLNFIVFYNVMLGTYKRRGHYDMVEKVALYWHFVDLVWVFVFTFFYLI